MSDLNIIQDISISGLIEKYNYFFVDLWGVLKNGTGYLESAIESLIEAQKQGRNIFFVSNTASYLPEKVHLEFKEKGLIVPPENIITSGSVLKYYFEKNDHKGSTVINIGEEGSSEYIKRAGGIQLAKEEVMTRYKEAELIIIGSHRVEEIFKMASLNAILHKNDIPVILINSDVVAPYSNTEYQFTAGSVAKSFQQVLKEEFHIDINLINIGKPNLYQEAYEIISKNKSFSLPKEEILIIGDSLYYDIHGGQKAGIDTLLVKTGTYQNDSVDQVLTKINNSGFYPKYF